LRYRAFYFSFINDMVREIPRISLPSGALMPVLGLGTWKMGERAREREREIAALQLGIDLGMTLIDTAEMYADGGAEELVGRAIEGQREKVFLVSKVYPHNATRQGAIAACKRSLERLRTDYLDLYLLHWRGSVPLVHTIAAFEALRGDGRIRAWGVSNFDRNDMDELFSISGGRQCGANQVLYHLGCRGVEWDLLPFCRRHRIPMVAYSPVGQAKLLKHRTVKSVARRVGITPAQLVLAWVLRQPGVAAIPKASSPEHIRENRAAAEIDLDPSALTELDRVFPPPTRAMPLAML
jgi:diketogulonate reductase-like aldo/keto reductase